MPVQDPIARKRDPRKRPGERDELENLITDPWNKYLTNRDQIIAATSTRLVSVTLENQSASIGSTSFALGTLSAGMYIVYYYAAITTAATTSSSLTVTFGWTDEAVAKTYSGAAITGNTNATIQQGAIVLAVDGSSPVTYATTYASVGATAMVYKLDMRVAALAA